jgi:hypothetical protein
MIAGSAWLYWISENHVHCDPILIHWKIEIDLLWMLGRVVLWSIPVDAAEAVAWTSGDLGDFLANTWRLRGIVPPPNHCPRLFGDVCCDVALVPNPCDGENHSFSASGTVEWTVVHPFPFFVHDCYHLWNDNYYLLQHYFAVTISTRRVERDSLSSQVRTFGKKAAASHRSAPLAVKKSIDARYSFPPKHRVVALAANSRVVAT